MFENLQLETKRKRVKLVRVSKDKDKKILWRGLDFKLKDMWRNNVLDNDDVVDSVKKRQDYCCNFRGSKEIKYVYSFVECFINILNNYIFYLYCVK